MFTEVLTVFKQLLPSALGDKVLGYRDLSRAPK